MPRPSEECILWLMPRTDSRVTGIVIAVASAVVVVTVAVVALPRVDGSTGPAVAHTPTGALTTSAPPSPTPTPTTTLPARQAGWRTETYRDLEIQVPSSWGIGTLGDPCDADDGLGTPMVERPFGVDDLMLCEKRGSGYGALFAGDSIADFSSSFEPGVLVRVVDNEPLGPGSPDFPTGSWAGYQRSTSGDDVVFIAASDKTVARQVLDSARTVTRADRNGCAVRLDGAAPAVEEETVAVCTYEEGGALALSELISGDAAAAVAAALDAAPTDDRPLGCAARPEPVESVLLREPRRESRVVYASSCAQANAVVLGDERRRLTPEVLYWALSPGPGRVFDGDVELPDQFR